MEMLQPTKGRSKQKQNKRKRNSGGERSASLDSNLLTVDGDGVSERCVLRAHINELPSMLAGS